jgi:hypothetical protein
MSTPIGNHTVRTVAARPLERHLIAPNGMTLGSSSP